MHNIVYARANLKWSCNAIYDCMIYYSMISYTISPDCIVERPYCKLAEEVHLLAKSSADA